MKTTLKIFSIVAIVLGSLAILGSLAGDVYAFIGGALFLTQGIIALIYIGQQTRADRRAFDITERIIHEWPLNYKLNKDGKKTK